MKPYLRCALGMHEYELYKELQLIANTKDSMYDNVGITLVNKCKYCGKITYTDIVTRIKR